MPIKFSYSKDPLYLQGRKEGRAMMRREIEGYKKENKKIYLKLMCWMSIEEIATEFDVPEEYLEALKEEKN